MKKGRSTTYALIAAVAMIWGTIIYKVVDAYKGDDDSPVLANNTTIKKEPYNDYAIPKDTAHLLLNYKDPFRLKKERDTVPMAIKRVHNTLAVVTKPGINWSFIKYSGYMRNPVSKKTIALLTINGRNVTLAEGESVDNVKLLKNMRDSIKISYNGKTKFITSGNH